MKASKFIKLAIVTTLIGGAGLAPLSAAQAKMPAVDTNGHVVSFADLSESLLPSVVNISSTQKVEALENLPDMPDFPPGSPFEDFFEEFMDRNRGNPDGAPSSLGSGFIVDAEKGYIITNNHVIANSDEIRVVLHNDESLSAKVIGTDEKTDIAILQIDPKGHDLKAVPFGDSADMRIGDWVLAIGNPFGLGGTVTAGIISARKRDIQSGPYDDYIQTDASINRGNSGGPMFNMKGEVIGINTAIYSPTGGSVGIGFAIPANLAKPVISQLLEYGRTRRGWLGVRIQKVSDEIAESLGLSDASGALVASINADSPAQKAGFEAGDIILKFNEQKINEMRDLPRIVAETKIDSTVKVDVWRNGKAKTLKVKIGELEKAEEEGKLESGPKVESEDSRVEIEEFGMSLMSLTPNMRKQFGMSDDAKGVFITDIDPDGVAARKGISSGDVIVEIDQKAVKSPAEVKKIIAKLKKMDARAALLLIDQQGQGSVRFVALKFEAPKAEDE